MTEVIVFVHHDHVRAVGNFGPNGHHRNSPDIIATWPEQGNLDRWRAMKIDRVTISDGCGRRSYYDDHLYAKQYYELISTLKMCMKPDGIWIEL